MNLKQRIDKLEEATEPKRGGVSRQEVVGDDGTIITMIGFEECVILIPSSRQAVKDRKNETAEGCAG